VAKKKMPMKPKGKKLVDPSGDNKMVKGKMTDPSGDDKFAKKGAKKMPAKLAEKMTDKKGSAIMAFKKKSNKDAHRMKRNIGRK